jgi:hypothetical protein
MTAKSQLSPPPLLKLMGMFEVNPRPTCFVIVVVAALALKGKIAVEVDTTRRRTKIESVRIGRRRIKTADEVELIKDVFNQVEQK